jgi:hypothetical protein
MLEERDDGDLREEGNLGDNGHPPTYVAREGRHIRRAATQIRFACSPIGRVVGEGIADGRVQ